MDANKCNQVIEGEKGYQFCVQPIGHGDGNHTPGNKVVK